MLERIKSSIVFHVRQNLILYLIVFFAFLTGITSGAFTVSSMPTNQKDYLGGYIQHFFETITTYPINRFSIFQESVLKHIQTTFFIWLFGLFFICIPFALIVIGMQGFFTGFTIGFLVGHYGFGGFLFSLICILPQTLIYVPCIIGMGVFSLSFALKNFKKRKLSYSRNEKFKNMAPYTVEHLFCFLVLFSGSLFETFITPLFFRLFQWVFI